MSLTEADKRCLENQFGQVSRELRQVRTDRQQARGEIGSARGEIEPVCSEARQVSAEFASVHSQFARFETNVLNAFRNLASSTEAWYNAHCTKPDALELEVHALQDRVAKLENPENR